MENNIENNIKDNMENNIENKLKLNFEIGNKVYVPTPSHGFVEAKIVNIVKNKNEINSISIKYVDDFIKETYGTDEVLYTNSNIQKIVSKTKNVSRPFVWMAINRKEFPEWVTETYMKYSSCNLKNNITKNLKDNSFDFLPRQKFIRDYLGHNSPYRGLLLYHGLGTGKTCAAVAVSENLKDTRNIVILLPKSIRDNFKKGVKECGDSKYKTINGNKLIENTYSFITYNSATVVKQIEAVGSLNNKVIIVDEAHNLATLMVNGLRGTGKQGYDIYKSLFEAKNSKIVFLTGTPLVNTPFEIAILFNILRGPLEVIIFKINNFSEDTVDDYIAALINDERIGWVDVNRRNQSLQVILKLNSWDMEFEQTVRFVESQARNYNAYVNFEKIDSYPLFPEKEEDFESLFIKDNNFINKDMFQRRIVGLTSFYQNESNKSKAISDFPEQFPDNIVKVEMSSHQFEIYEKARDIEKKKERRAAQEMKKKLKGEKMSTLARVFSREFSNFVFPDEIIRPFQKMQFISATLEEKLEKEKKENTNVNIPEKINKETLDKLIKEALVKLSDPTKQYLKPGKYGLSKYSPKMEAMLNEINKNQKELILVYSSYRTVEGLEIFSRVLNANGYEQYNLKQNNLKQNENYNDKYDYKRYAFFSGKEDMAERKKVIETYVNSENKHGKNIRVLLVSAAGAEGLDLKNIRKVLIMEPYWHNVRLQQIIGRAVRKKSHYDLPENERNVQPIIYLSILSPEQLEISKEKISTDEHIYSVAQKKLKLNLDVLKLVQESAIDCMLNECDSKKCYQFKGKGLAYLPQLSEDIVYGYNNIIKKEFKRDLTVSGITDLNEIVYLKVKDWFYGNGKPFNGKPKTIKGKKYAADLTTLELFDYDSVKKGIPLLIGKINEIDSKFNEL